MDKLPRALNEQSSTRTCFEGGLITSGVDQSKRPLADMCCISSLVSKRVFFLSYRSFKHKTKQTKHFRRDAINYNYLVKFFFD